MHWFHFQMELGGTDAERDVVDAEIEDDANRAIVSGHIWKTALFIMHDKIYHK